MSLTLNKENIFTKMSRQNSHLTRHRAALLSPITCHNPSVLYGCFKRVQNHEYINNPISPAYLPVNRSCPSFPILSPKLSSSKAPSIKRKRVNFSDSDPDLNCPLSAGLQNQNYFQDRLNPSVDQKKDQLGFHQVHGILVRLTQNCTCASLTESDKSRGFLSYIFSSRPINLFEKVSLRVTMGGQRGVSSSVGFSNENPTTFKILPTSALSDLFKESSLIDVRSQEKSSVITIYVNGNGKIQIKIDGKVSSGGESIQKNLDTSKPFWIFLRLHHKRDKIEIINI